MEKFAKGFLLTSLVLVLCLGGTVGEKEDGLTSQPTTTSFGTVVQSGDPDVGLPLDNFASFQSPLNLYFWDIGTESGQFDAEDVVYLNIGNTSLVMQNDIRLTPFGTLYPAGSKVTSDSNDIGQKIGLLISDSECGEIGDIFYMDLFGVSGGYDSGDSVYVNAIGMGIGPWAGSWSGAVADTNDVRLTEISNYGLPAGKMVKNFDEDHNKPIFMMVDFPVIFIPGGTGGSIAGPLSIGTIRFYNANGNVKSAATFNVGPGAPGDPIYDRPDVVYIDVPWQRPILPCPSYPPIRGIVSPGDVRLTPYG